MSGSHRKHCAKSKTADDNDKSTLLKRKRQKNNALIRQAGQRRTTRFCRFQLVCLSVKLGCPERALRRREAATTCIYGHVLRSLSYFFKFLDEKFEALSSPKNTHKILNLRR
jgi:hypothetical protein